MRVLPYWPAIFMPLNTRAGVAHAPIEPGERCFLWLPCDAPWPEKLWRFITPEKPLPLLMPVTSTRSPAANTSAFDHLADLEARRGRRPAARRGTSAATVSRAPDYWSAKKMSPEERMDHMATLDGSVAGPWAGVGRDQLDWLSKTLADWDKSRPIVIFTHNPLYEYYPPWNFWVRDWRDVYEVLKPYTNVTNIHGHVHQVLYNEIGKMRSIGMLATSWPWPYAPEGVPKLTVPMIRADPGDFYDGVGWSTLSMNNDKIENEYIMWGRKEVFATICRGRTTLSQPEILRPRIADRYVSLLREDRYDYHNDIPRLRVLRLSSQRSWELRFSSDLPMRTRPGDAAAIGSLQRGVHGRGQEGRSLVPWR